MKTNCRILLLPLIALASCGKPSSPSNDKNPSTVLPDEITSVLSAMPAAAPRSVSDLVGSAGPGDLVTVSGRIMGSESPFVVGRAAFLLGDPGVLTPCNEKPGDNCATPWDVCCDSPEDKRRATATVRILDATGRVLRASLENVGGLGNLASVTVTGKVSPDSAPGSLMIDASAIRVEISQ